MTAAPQRVLLIQLHHLGDVLLTTPAIRAARRAFPDATIDFASGALGASALAGNPHLDAILAQPRLRDIFRRRYDAVVDFHSVPRSARLVAASRARTRIGLRGRGPRNLAYTQLLPRETGAVYMALQKLRMLAPLGVAIDPDDLGLELAVPPDEHAAAREIVRAGSVVISPVARHPFKQWGARRWAAVGDALAARGARVLLTHGPGEAEQAQEVASAMTHEACVHGARSVQQLAAIYGQCRLWLGNDGGPKHVAVAAGVPTVTVYRRKLGYVWSDPRDARQIALNADDESPIAIAPEAVIAAATRLLDESA